MGNSGSSSNVNVPRNVSLVGVDLEELAKTTHCMSLDEMNLLFSLRLDEINELQQMLNQWKKETPNGVIFKREFKEFLTGVGLYEI
jgi:hypothetical protein